MARTSRKQEKSLPCDSIPAIKVALYVRLSNEDNGGKGKDSISNQCEFLQKFAECFENTEIIDVYVDNGRTGTDFERPEWERLMKDIRKQKINCIIVKDLSRFARNYIEAGDYLEKIFPFLGVRFIAVNDQYDSANELFHEKDLITEFKNLANDYYSKDISKKILSAFEAKKRQGKYIGNKAPYGYELKSNKLVVDEWAARVVRKIFAWKMQGVSSYEIAMRLNQENESSPSKYAKEKGIKKYRNSKDVLWQQQAVNRILYNRVYIGDLVQGRYNKSIYSKETFEKKDMDTWKIAEGTHEAIIDRKLFYQIQEIKEKNRRIWKARQGKPGYGNVLEGILVCGICHRALKRSKEIRNGKIRYYFYCRYIYDHTQSKCNTSGVADYKIFDTVLKQIQLQIKLVVQLETMMLQNKENNDFTSEYQIIKQEWNQVKRELDRQVYLKTRIYEKMKQGILTQEEYLIEKKKYMVIISGLETQLRQKEKEIKESGQCVVEQNRWLKLFRHFSEATELTREMAVGLLERVEVFGDKRIHIQFRFKGEYEYLKSILDEGGNSVFG